MFSGFKMQTAAFLPSPRRLGVKFNALSVTHRSPLDGARSGQDGHQTAEVNTESGYELFVG